VASSALERRLGPLDAAALIVSNVIGGGILFTPPQVAALVPDAPLFLSTWIAGGALAFAGAMAYAELAALRPRAGGEYVYLREAFGEGAAFLTGWTSFVAGFSGAIATSAVVMVFYLGRFAPALAASGPWLVVPLVPGALTLTLSPQTVTAVAIIAAMAWLHRRGIGPGRVVGNLLASLKVTAFALFIVVGFGWGSGTLSHLSESAPVGAGSWLLALIPVMFTYSGWNAAAYVAEEIRDPGRNVPRALAMGTAAVVLIYVLMNALYLYVIPARELAAVNRSVLDVIADLLLGGYAGNIMGVVSIISLAASISAMTLAGPRLLQHGAGRPVLPAYRHRSSALPHTVGGHHCAGRVERRPRADRDSRRACDLHRLRDRALFWDGGPRPVRVTKTRAGRTASVPCVGLSDRSGDLRDRQPGDSGEWAISSARRNRGRAPDHRRRFACVYGFSAATNPKSPIPKPKSQGHVIWFWDWGFGIWDFLLPPKRPAVSDLSARVNPDVEVERRVTLRHDLDVMRPRFELQCLECSIVIVHASREVSIDIHVPGSR
jgi:Amino acid permease